MGRIGKFGILKLAVWKFCFGLEKFRQFGMLGKFEVHGRFGVLGAHVKVWKFSKVWEGLEFLGKFGKFEMLEMCVDGWNV